MKKTATSTREPSLNFLLIAMYILAFFVFLLLLYGAVPMLGDLLFELKENAAARMLN